MGYCLPTDLKVSATYTEADKTAAIEAATEMIEKATGDSFHKHTGEIRLFSGSGRFMLLISPGLYGLTSVEILDDINMTWDLLDPDEFDWARGWIKRRYFVIPVGTNNVRVIGNFGYASVPWLIKLSCARLAAELLVGSPGVIQSEHLGSYSVSYKLPEASDALSTSISSIVEQYRLHKVLGGRVVSGMVVSLDTLEQNELLDDDIR